MPTETLYSIARDGKTIGQYTLAQIREGLKAGTFKITDHYWTDGMGSWVVLSVLAKKISDEDASALEARLQQARRQEAEQKAEQARKQAERTASAPKTADMPAGAANLPVAVGSGLVFVGGFMPMLSAPVFSGASMSLIGNGTGETAVCAFFAARTAVAALYGLPMRVAYAFWAGVALLTVPLLKFAYLVIKIGTTLSKARTGISRVSESSGASDWSFSYNPFDGIHLSLVELLPIPLELGVGFACVLLGTLTLYRAWR